MKKLIFCASAAFLLLASCGKSETCNCVDTLLKISKEAKAANGDMTKIKAIQDKNKEALDNCDKLIKADNKKFEDEAKKCDGYAELDKMMKGGM
jgi:hypothetical protein